MIKYKGSKEGIKMYAKKGGHFKHPHKITLEISSFILI